jgi:hypothetical protein
VPVVTAAPGADVLIVDLARVPEDFDKKSLSHTR